MNQLRAEQMVGTVFAGHRIEAIIGTGGMGTVYRALDLALERAIALKTIKPELAGDSEFQRRFVSECRLAASIDHPNVIDVFHAGEQDGVLYVAMRLVEGHDLRAVLAHTGALDRSVAVAIAVQAGAALDAAHERGLIHRDVKPANVLLRADEHVFLTDFGLSKRVSADAEETVTSGVVLGTLNYIAPEQIKGEADPRSDVYSLGCVVFEMLTGSVPFAVSGYEQKLWAHLSTEPPALTALRPDLPAELDTVVQRALRKRPEERYESAAAFAHDLQATAHTVSRPRPLPAWRAHEHVEPASRGLGPELAALVTDADAATRAIRKHIKRGHSAFRDDLDALRIAMGDGAHGVESDLNELRRNPPADLRARLREELMRGTKSSKRLVLSLKGQLLAMQSAERRIEAFRLEVRRQLVELDTVGSLLGAIAKNDPEAQLQLAGRVASLRHDLRALVDDMARERAR